MPAHIIFARAGIQAAQSGGCARPCSSTAAARRAIGAADAPTARRARVVLAAAQQEAASAESTAPKPFLDELRAHAMALHTREQAPREGKAEAPKEQPPWQPTREGYLCFLVESRVVYAAFESLLAGGAGAGAPGWYSQFVGTGLERCAALDADIAEMRRRWGLAPPAAAPDGPGHAYAALLRRLAVESPPAFMCHYYNFYFAHTAGGRMIGAQVSKACLDMWLGDFYKWDGDVKALLAGVRARFNAVAEGWGDAERRACMDETPRTFSCSGSLLRCIGGGGGGGGH